MSHLASDTDLVRVYLKPVLDGRYGMEEFLSENPPPVKRRQAYRWKAALASGEDVTLKAETRRELISLMGMDPQEVLPYRTRTEQISESGGEEEGGPASAGGNGKRG